MLKTFKSVDLLGAWLDIMSNRRWSVCPQVANSTTVKSRSTQQQIDSILLNI